MNEKDMTEEQKAHYEEWKKKCAATRARNLTELHSEHQHEWKPGFKLITRGPRKGQFKWMGYKQQSADRSAIVFAQSRKAIDALKPTEPLADKSPREKPKFSWEFVIAIIFIYSVSIISFFISKAFASFGVLGLAVFVDFAVYSIKKKRRYGSKYLPFLWWL